MNLIFSNLKKLEKLEIAIFSQKSKNQQNAQINYLTSNQTNTVFTHGQYEGEFKMLILKWPIYILNLLKWAIWKFLTVFDNFGILNNRIRKIEFI